MRVACGIEYDGTGYVGWQRQTSGVGIQAQVEQALSKVANETVRCVCAGRTDAGVHATNQVIHFDTSAGRAGHNWVLGVNSNLPDDVNMTWAIPVPEDFHARFSATKRSYEYVILNRKVRSALARNRAWWLHEPLDTGLMQTAADRLVGRHDFSAFRATGCQANTPVRTVSSLTVRRDGDIVLISVSANAFLQHMVRNIVGILAAIGHKKRSPEWASQVLQSRDRTSAGVTAPPQGLTLVEIEYPEQFELPVRSD